MSLRKKTDIESMSDKNFKLEGEKKHSLGMTVPEGYFSDFSKRMSDMLPYNEAAESGKVEEVVRRTWWQRSRPYIYMAAMFAGIWCMTQMFSMMKQPSDTPIESNAVMTAALSNDEFVDDYIYASMSQYDMLDDLYESGISFSENN